MKAHLFCTLTELWCYLSSVPFLLLHSAPVRVSPSVPSLKIAYFGLQVHKHRWRHLHAACSIWKHEHAQIPKGKKPELISSHNRWCVTSCKVNIQTGVLRVSTSMTVHFFYHMMLHWQIYKYVKKNCATNSSCQQHPTENYFQSCRGESQALGS